MSAELDVDAPEAQLAPRPGHTEPDWDTEDAERWLRALITEVRRLRDRVQEVELQRDVARTLHGSWRQRAERVEAAAQPLARCQTPTCRCGHPVFRHEAGDCDECDCTLSRVGAAATAHDCGACDGCRLLAALAGASAPEREPDGTALIAAERRRQVEAEGWTPEHDDGHDRQELLYAAGCYLAAGRCAELRNDTARFYAHPPPMGETWPWEDAAWKPSNDPQRNLVRAGALIAAEIDRLQRAEDADRIAWLEAELKDAPAPGEVKGK